jgi:hypothetical protein
MLRHSLQQAPRVLPLHSNRPAAQPRLQTGAERGLPGVLPAVLVNAGAECYGGGGKEETINDMQQLRKITEAEYKEHRSRIIALRSFPANLNHSPQEIHEDFQHRGVDIAPIQLRHLIKGSPLAVVNNPEFGYKELKDEPISP